MAEKTEKKYVITNHRSGKVLASCGGSAVQMTANGGETQVWCAVPAEGTSVQLVHKVSSLALTVPGESARLMPSARATPSPYDGSAL